MNKLYKIIVMILISVCTLISCAYGYSDEFELMVQTMGTSIQNSNGKFLNEEIYNAYSLFVYGSPLDKFSGQRWKDVVDGRWTKSGGVWNDEGIRGEYWILGENEEGYEVHNHKFPVDIEPPTKPTEWRYAVLNNALNSWQDQTKYMDDFQKEYMLTSKLTRNDVTYDITVNDIGLNKVRLENYATWKTKGSVYTERYDSQGKRWAANFMVPALAADAELEGYAIFENGTKYKITDDEDSINIPIKFGAKVNNLSEYARKEHVRELKTELYINNELVSSISSGDVLAVEDSVNYNVSKTENQDIIILNVCVKSSLVTKFKTDGALVDIKNYTLTINCSDVEEIVDDEEDENKTYFNQVENRNVQYSEDVPPPVIDSIKIKRIVNNTEESLPVSKKTGNEFICAGQTISVEVVVRNAPDKVSMEFEGDSSIFTFDETTKKFEWTEPKKRGVKTFYSTLDQFKDMYKNKITITDYEIINLKTNARLYRFTYIIPYETEQTLNSWATLRKASGSAFEIDNSKLFTRIKSPYEVVIKAVSLTGVCTERRELDVFERWDTLYNRDISSYVK